MSCDVRIDRDGKPYWFKDPAATLPYRLRWRDWLEGGALDAIEAVTAEAGITVVSSAIEDDDTVVWVSGGAAGADYLVTVRVRSGSKVDERSFRLKVRER